MTVRKEKNLCWLVDYDGNHVTEEMTISDLEEELDRRIQGPTLWPTETSDCESGHTEEPTLYFVGRFVERTIQNAMGLAMILILVGAGLLLLLGIVVAIVNAIR